jgi:hypothetical protein
MRTLPWVVVGAILVPGIPLAGPTDPLERTVSVRADFRRLDERTFPVDVELGIRNGSRDPIDRIDLVLFSERYRGKLPHLNDLNTRRIYPFGYSYGGFSVQDLTDGSGRPLASEREGTLLRVKLAEPLAAGAGTRLRLSGKLTVPEKTGPFGYDRGTLTLAGGWFPYVASYREGRFRPEDLPPRADLTVDLVADGDLLLGGTLHRRAGAELRVRAVLRGVREASLEIAARMAESTIHGQRHRVRLVWPRPYESRVRTLRELAVQWLDFVRRTTELDAGSEEVTLAVAPLRESIAIRGEGVTYLSDRIFALWSGLRQYHSGPVVHGLFYQLVLPAASARESSREYHQAAEAVAWYWTERFMEDRAYVSVDARTLAPVRFFKFLYAIDRLVYAPQFAFYDVFYNMVYPDDPLRDDPLTFNHERPFGRTVFAHAQDGLSAERAARAASRYLLPGAGTLVAEFEREGGEAVRGEYLRWTEPRPPVNYRIEKPEAADPTDPLRYRIRLIRQAPEGFVEPVELRVEPGRGEPLWLRWDGKGGNEKTFEFRAEEGVETIQLDPRGRLDETRLSDNRIPPRMKAVLTQLILNFDFNELQPIGFIATEIRREYGARNLYDVSASYNVDSFGVGVGYTRLFGRIIDRLRLSHGLSVGYGFSRLAELDTGVTDPATGERVGVVSAPEAYDGSLAVSYFFGNRLSLTNPLSGGGAAASVGGGSEALGGDANYLTAAVGGSWICPFAPNSLLALRGSLATSGPSDIPGQAMYALGGLGGMRGLSVSDDRFRGRHRILAGAEFRQILLSDIDWNFWLFRLRDVQAVVFGDGGRTTDTLQERAEQLYLAATAGTGFGDLFRIGGWEADAGAGVRFLIDWLGVNPGLVGFDAAKGLTDSESGWLFYFTVSQSF